MVAIRYAILTVGDAYARGEVKDEAAEALEGLCGRLGWELTRREVLSSEEGAVARWIAQIADEGIADLILTLDGVGLRPSDRVPEAAYQVLEKYVTGPMEILRAKLSDASPAFALSRGVAGVRGRTLVVNLPGTPLQAKQAMDVLKNLLRQAVEQIKS